MELLRFGTLSLDAIGHFVTTRAGGESSGSFASLNLALHVGDDETVVLQNRKKVAEQLGLELESFILAEQVHGSKVAVVGKNEQGCGAQSLDSAISGVDALVCTDELCALAVNVADCAAVILVEPEACVIAVAHAGWRGSFDEIVVKTVEAMCELGAKPQNIVAAISPCIGVCCYEVGSELAIKFVEKFGGVGVVNKEGKSFLDLAALNVHQLKSCGIKTENIEVSGLCTCCDERFFSYRRDNGQTGRIWAGVYLLQKL